VLLWGGGTLRASDGCVASRPSLGQRDSEGVWRLSKQAGTWAAGLGRRGLEGEGPLRTPDGQ